MIIEKYGKCVMCDKTDFTNKDMVCIECHEERLKAEKPKPTQQDSDFDMMV